MSIKNQAYNGRVMTLEQVGAELGITGARVQVIEKEALIKVKEYLFKRFGNRVTMHDILPNLEEGIDYALFEL